MTTAATVLIAVATELAKTAKSSMPEIRNGERILREWLDNGIYFRETEYEGAIFRNQYDFRQRKCR